MVKGSWHGPAVPYVHPVHQPVPDASVVLVVVVVGSPALPRSTHRSDPAGHAAVVSSWYGMHR